MKNKLISWLSLPFVAKRLFFGFTCIKIVGYLIFLYSDMKLWMPMEDADKFDGIARGVLDIEHPWAGILKTMNIYGLYSREYISLFIFLINCILVPWLVFKVCNFNRRAMPASGWYLLIAVTLYPTMTIYSMDIFRDIVMVVLFLIFLTSSRNLLYYELSDWQSYRALGWVVLAAVSWYLIFVLRFYLAGSLLLAIGACKFLDISRRAWIFLLLYLIGLTIGDFVGLFDVLKGSFRADFKGAGSEYAISFVDGVFIVNFIKSFFYGVYGFYVYNFTSAIVFLIESVPAIFLTHYIYKNRKYASQYVNFLIFFFFIYGAMWSIGVDALGAAVRYRVFNYLALLMSAFFVFEAKIGGESNENVSQ